MSTTATATETKPAFNAGFLYAELMKRFDASPMDVQQRITGHIRAKTGHTTLPSYHNNGATDEDKCGLYQECLKAILKKNFDGLSKMEEKVAVAKVEVKEQKPEPVANRMKKADVVEVSTVTGTTAPAESRIDPKFMPVIAALQAAMGGQSSSAVDEEQVKRIVGAVIGDRMAELEKRVGSAILDSGTAVREYLNKIPPRDVIEIRKWDGEITEITDAVHKQLGLIIKMLAARNAGGWSEFIYIYGAPGAGKTHLLKQIAKALGVKAYPFPCGPSTTEGKMLGFNNIANGSFVAGWLYEPFKNGGVVGLDEIALSDAGVLGATNSIENETFTFGNGEVVQRHRDFYLVAFDNTLGTGATGGFTRNKLDAATLNRFTHLKLEYDEDLERRIFGNEKWADYVIKVRHYVEKNCNQSIYITPRATRKGAAYLAAGIPVEQVCDMVLFSLCSKEIKETVLKNVGTYTA